MIQARNRGPPPAFARIYIGDTKMFQQKHVVQGQARKVDPNTGALGPKSFPPGSLISVPREDGAVQHVDWNNYLKNKGTLVPSWANRWMFLQDTLKVFVGALTQNQKNNIEYNLGNTRMMLGMMYAGNGGQQTLSTLGWTWLPYDESKGDANRTAIIDAVSFTDDFVIPKGMYAGQLSVGTWAKDIAGLIPFWEEHGYWMNQNPPSSSFPIGLGK